MALEPDRASGKVTQRRGVISTGTLAQLVERMPYTHQVVGSIPTRPTILKALSQVGKAQDSDSCTDGSNPSGPAISTTYEQFL